MRENAAAKSRLSAWSRSRCFLVYLLVDLVNVGGVRDELAGAHFPQAPLLGSCPAHLLSGRSSGQTTHLGKWLRWKGKPGLMRWDACNRLQSCLPSPPRGCAPCKCNIRCFHVVFKYRLLPATTLSQSAWECKLCRNIHRCFLFFRNHLNFTFNGWKSETGNCEWSIV